MTETLYPIDRPYGKVMRVAGHTMGTPDYTLEEAFRLFADFELDAAEIVWQDGYRSGIPEAETDGGLQVIRRLAESLKLEIACLTPYMTAINSLNDAEREADIERFRRCIHAAEALGAHRIRVYAGSYRPTDEPVRDEKWTRLVEALRELGGQAATAGVVLCVENHFNTMAMTAAETARLMQAVGSSGVGILYDQANLTFTHSEAWPEAVEIQRQWIRHVHVKDLVFRNPLAPFAAAAVEQVREDERQVRSRVIGDGILDWGAILGALVGVGYRGYLSLEYEYRWHPGDLPDPREGFRRSAAVMRSLLASLPEVAA